jgi:acetyl-CoA synthetase
LVASDVNQDPPIWEPSTDIAQQTAIAAFLRQHDLADLKALLGRADAEPDWYWNALLEFFDIQFVQPYSKVLDVSKGIEWPRWCVGGTTNVVLNCLDRHRGTPVWQKTAIIWEGEDGSRRSWSYTELDAEVSRLAGALKSRKIAPGDVVAIYMPMIPEAAAAFLAIAKIGAIAMPLFSGFGPQPITERLIDAEARAVITVDVGRRRGKLLQMKETLDRALAAAKSVHTVVILVREREEEVSWSSRDVPWPVQNDGAVDVPTEIVDAETPVMLMYSSGTTGKPKGTVHTHCGMLAKNALDVGLCIDLKATDRLLWMSDMGWIVGPKIVVSATLLGATLVLAEGTPDWPQESRMWHVAADNNVTVIGIVPTMVRQMMRRGPELLAGCDLLALRTTISIGEPWTQDAWIWFFEHVCKRRIPILNYAGGTECGGAILISSFLSTLRPCSFGHAVPGCGADVVDAAGRSLAPGEIGELVMRRPSIGMTRGLWRASDRYIESYWKIIPGMWVQGDLASRDIHGAWYMHGRSDDTIKIAGKRTGPSEIEMALMATGLLADAAVVGVPDAITGSALACACVPISPIDDTVEFAQRLARAVADNFGASYRPKQFIFVSELPRTRNQKVMRRVIRGVLTGTPLGDLSSLANPESIDSLRSKIVFAPATDSDTLSRPATTFS